VTPPRRGKARTALPNQARASRRRRADVVSLFLSLFLSLLPLAPETARAETAGKTPSRAPVVLFSTPDDPLAGRLAAEIAAQGLSVERLATPSDLEAAVRRALAAGTRVAVYADAGRRRTEVWGSGDIALKQAVEVPDVTARDAALPVLALRTVELLRVEFGLGPAPPADTSPAPAAPARSPPPPEPLPPTPTVTSSAAATAPPALPVTIAVAWGILASAGRLGPQPIAGLGLAAQMARYVGAELWGYVPLASDELHASAGTARTSVWLAAAGIRLAPPPGGRLAFDFGAGPLLALVRAHGTATPPAMGATDQQLAIAVYARAAAAFRAGAHWSFGLQLLAGTALRRPVITFVDEDITRWGTAFAATTLSAAYAF
jgi:hypothetical protein